MQINLGSFPTNEAPTVTLTADATNALPGAALNFQATATDRNGDSLAYYWDFGDGGFGTNGPTAGHSWGSIGEYVLRCRVTDLKGGNASRSLIVVVGSPDTYRISGKITEAGAPLENVRIYVSSTQMTYTDSDGMYTLVGLPAASYTVYSSLYGYTFNNSGFSNPVSVGPDAGNIDFTGSPNPPSIVTQPQRRTVHAASDATFTVVASGAPPLRYQWCLNGLDITGATASSYTRSNVQIEDEGNYTVVVTNANGSVTSVVAALTVIAPPIITWQPQSQIVNAGSNATFTVGASGRPPLDYLWIHNGTNLLAGATNSSLTITNVEDSDAGFYSVLIVNNDGGVLSSNAWLTVFLKADQTIDFGSMADKTYGDPPFQITAGASSGLAVLLSVVSGPATINSNNVTLFGAGTVVIRASQDGNSNYLAAADVVQTFIVNTPDLTVKANDATKVYGTANPVFGGIITGFVNGETMAVVAGAPIFNTTATSGSPVGTYPITAAPGTLSASNYNLIFADGTLVITKATLTVTADDAIRMYGSPNPILGATMTGFVIGDSPAVVSGLPALATQADAGSPAGIYAITPAPGTLSATNYDFVFVDGTLTVRKAVLAVTAADVTRPYGAPNPSFTATMTGFQNGDTSAVVTGFPSFTTTATPGAPAGSYAIESGMGTLAANNYDFIFDNGILTITEVGPILGALSRLADGQVRFLLIGVPGATHIVEGSQDLLDWVPLLATNSPDGLIEFTDPAAANFPNRFYRAVLP